jgi:dephospho-CoA kinase
MVVAITGGIASGKSTVTKQLADGLGATVFDSDLEARRLVDEDADVRRELVETFGPSVVSAEGRVDRPALRRIVFDDEARRRGLEGILHPRIRAAWRRSVEEHLHSTPIAPLVIDIPLLYETGAEVLLDRVVVVGCRFETQLRRLTEIRHLDETVARKIIASQFPLADKISRCQHLIWNDSTPFALEAQVKLLVAHLRQLES